MALQTSVNRRSSLRSSSERRPGSVFSDSSAWKSLDRLLEAVAPDEPHGVVRPAVAVGAQAVDRDDARVLQPAGDLGLEQEPLAAGRVVGVVVEDLLEGDLAVQLAVERHEDGTQPAPGVGPEDAEPLAVAGRRADGVGGRSRSTSPSSVEPCAEPTWPRVASMSGSPSRGQALARRLAGRDRGQALLHVAAVGFLRCTLGQRLQTGTRRGSRGRRGLPGGRPGSWTCRSVQAWKAATSWPWLIMPVLEREQSEEEMAVGGGGHGVAPIGDGRSGEGPSLRGRPGNRVASAGLSQVATGFASAPSPGLMHWMDVIVAAVAGGMIINREHNKT